MFDFTPNALTAGSVAWHHAMPEDGDLCYWLPSLGAGTTYPATIHLVRLRRNDEYDGGKRGIAWFMPVDLGPVTFSGKNLLVPETEGRLYGRLPGPHGSGGGTLVQRSPETDALAAMLALAIRERAKARHAVSVLTAAVRGNAPETARRLEDLAAAAEALLDTMSDGCDLADDCREERSGVFHASSCPEAIALRAAVARVRSDQKSGM